MAARSTAATLIPPDASLDELARIAAGCTACDLHRTGTRTVFGEGPADAAVVLVGEQPGDREDLEGHPVRGTRRQGARPGDGAVGLDEVPQYRTNVVKHFKWAERRGKRRIHESPNRIEIRACLPWLQAELTRTAPDVLVTLGATATKALLGWDVRVTSARGRLHLGPDRRPTIPTVPPSSVLRARSDADRLAAREAFHVDLLAVATAITDGVTPLLEDLTVAELRGFATTVGLCGWRGSRKAALVERLTGELRR